jgi:hypothetical protein
MGAAAVVVATLAAVAVAMGACGEPPPCEAEGPGSFECPRYWGGSSGTPANAGYDAGEGDARTPDGSVDVDAADAAASDAADADGAVDATTD